MEAQPQVGASHIPDEGIPAKDIPLQERLQSHLNRLAVDIGERNIYHYAKLQEAGQYIEHQFILNGYTPRRQNYEHEQKVFFNVEAELVGDNPDLILVIGTHIEL